MTQKNSLDTAMIFAAGRGSRMRHLTENCPKPMLEVSGKSIIKRLIDELPSQGIKNVIVNLHYKGDILADHLSDIRTPNIILSPEDELLETGGGCAKALPLIGDQPFWAFNGDMLWHDGEEPMLERMRNLWDPSKMDVLLLLHPTDKIAGFDGVGDYQCDENGCLTRTSDETAPYVFAGARIAKPEIFDGVTDKRFSFLKLFDEAEKKGRLYGLVHDGAWYHLSTPEMLEATEKDVARAA